MQDTINNKVVEALREHVPLRRERGAENPKLKVPHTVEKMYRRKKRASRQLKNRNLTLYKITSLRQKIEKIEEQISEFYEKKILKEESEAWQQMRLNPNFFYSYARRKKSTRTVVGPFIDDSGQISTKEVCQELNSCYMDQFSKVTEEPLPADYINSEEDAIPGRKTLSKIEITRDKILEAIKSFSSRAGGPSGMSVKLLKGIAKVISPFLVVLFKKIMERSDIPEINLISHIVPLLKSDKDPSKPASYRPVALTELIFRTLEKVVKNPILNHAEEVGAISQTQHGFRGRHSTLSNVLAHVENLIKQLESGKTVDCLLLDLAKAFDKCPHNRIIRRMKRAGFRGEVLGLIQAFLHGRKQRVIANGTISDSLPVLSGVPQGAVISPILFAIFIDDLAKVIGDDEASWALLFADDSKLAHGLDTEADMTEIQAKLEKVYAWVEDNGMQLNTDKTIVLRIGKLREGPRHYEGPKGEILEFKHEAKDLGLLASSKGNYEPQLDAVKKKVVQKVGQLLRTFKNRSMTFFQFIFKTYIRPIMDFGSPVWAPIRPTQIDELESVLNAFLRKIPALKGLHFWDRLQVMRIMSVQRRMERYIIMYAHQVLSGTVPNPGLSSKWTPKGRKIIIPPIPKKCPASARKLRDQSFNFRAAVLFNSMPAFVRNFEGSNLGFKNTLTEYLSLVPDHPRTIRTGYMPAPTDTNSQCKSNSLLHWRTYLERSCPKYKWH